MLWIIDDKNHESYNITRCNIFTKADGEIQLWVEKPSGKNMLIRRSYEQDEVELIKKAIDYAIESGETALRI